MNQVSPGVILHNRYKVIQQLGRGGLCQTFDVFDQNSSTLKVLKVFYPNRFSSEEKRRKSIEFLEREAQVLIRLRYPGIPKVDEDGFFTHSEPGEELLYCLVMEKIYGQNLEQYIENQNSQPISQEKAIDWLRQLALILETIHSQELIHRDIKPSNIMLRPGGELTLIDFGGVREITDTYLNQLKGTILISPGYSPPEQIEGRATKQSDFYALGRTFIYLVTGKRPIDIDRDPQTGQLLWHEEAPQISPPLKSLIDQLAARQPQRRPPTAATILYLTETVPPVFPEKLELPPGNAPNLARASQHPAEPKGGAVVSSAKSETPAYNWGVARLIQTIRLQASPVSAIVISPNSQIFVSGSHNGEINIWRVVDGEMLSTIREHKKHVSSLAINSNGSVLASGSHDKTILLWLINSSKKLHRLMDKSGKVHCVYFHPKGDRIISSSAAETNVWGVKKGNLLKTFYNTNTESIRQVACSPDGNSCIVGSLDGTIKFLNLHSGKELGRFSFNEGGVTSLVCSNDGKYLAACVGGKVILFDCHTYRRSVVNLLDSKRAISLAFSSDSQILAIGCERAIQLWNVEPMRLIGNLPGHGSEVRSVSLSRDNSFLVSGSQDTIKVWKAGL